MKVNCVGWFLCVVVSFWGVQATASLAGVLGDLGDAASPEFEQFLEDGSKLRGNFWKHFDESIKKTSTEQNVQNLLKALDLLADRFKDSTEAHVSAMEGKCAYKEEPPSDWKARVEKALGKEYLTDKRKDLRVLFAGHFLLMRDVCLEPTQVRFVYAYTSWIGAQFEFINSAKAFLNLHPKKYRQERNIIQAYDQALRKLDPAFRFAIVKPLRSTQLHIARSKEFSRLSHSLAKHGITVKMYHQLIRKVEL